MIQKLGNDFSKSYKINLLPGITLSRGYWQTHIQVTTYDGTVTEFQHGSYNHHGEPSDFDAIVGQDVYEINFKTHRHNSFPYYPNTYIKYTLRMDRIILLNLVYKFTKATLKF